MRHPTPDPISPGEESVWNYPRPPALEVCSKLIEIDLNGVTIVSTTSAIRFLETSHPPTYYLPEAAFISGVLQPADGSSFCEWKGTATYLSLVVGERHEVRAGWVYRSPTERYNALKDHVAVYPGRMDECRVDGEVVQPQEGGFYGGWITSDIKGPFKGGPGTFGW